MQELINKQSALSVCKEYGWIDDEDFVDCYNTAIKDMREAINELPTVADVPAVNRWISCNEKLPEIKVEVLVTLYNPELDGYFRKIGCFLGDEWLISNIYSSSMENVVAWMPMPDKYELPKVNSNE